MVLNGKKMILRFPHPSTSATFSLLLNLPLSPPDEANTVSESAEMLDVSPSITTNFIGQKTDESTDMCERSCEELSTMFRELKGLRVVVGNLIDGLQKVVRGWWSRWWWSRWWWWWRGRGVCPFPFQM